ncbi:hypothetical protein AHIS1_p066 [Acaryochloris phage A-HIS1]|nr:hypothetical protein AHIS1_p066 [Acaryochloris phage A-HIS1]
MLNFARLLYGYTFREGEPGSEGTPPTEPTTETPTEPKPKQSEANPPKTEEKPANPELEALKAELAAERQKNADNATALEELRKFKTDADEAADKARREKLEREDLLNEDLTKSQTRTAELERELAIAKANVPPELVALIPATGYAEYLESDAYTKVRDALTATNTVSKPTGENTPPTKPPAKETGDPPRKPKTFSEITKADYAELGRAFIGSDK